MKRAAAALLTAVTVALAMPSVGSATAWIDTDIEDYYDGYLHPGRAYYFPLMADDDQVYSGEDTGYRYRVEVEPRNAGVTASISALDGYEYVRVTVSSTAGREDEIYDITVTSTNRSDRDDTYEDTLTIEVGYGDTYFTSESELDLYDDATVIEFSDSVTTCYLYLPDGSEFAASLRPNPSRNQSEGVNRIIDFYASTDALYDVERRYGGTAWLEYLRFYTNYTFDTSLLKIYAPEQNYAYEADGSGNLYRLNAAKNGDFLVISTTALGSYVLSSHDLGVGYGTPPSGSSSSSSSGAVLPSGTPQAPTPMPSSGYSYPPATGGGSTYKPNPGTGAAA